MAQTYTAEQVEQMIAERLAAVNSKANKFVIKAGEFTTEKGEKKGYLGVEVQGKFRPRYLALSVAEAIVADPKGFAAAVEAARKAASAPVASTTDPLAPRLAKS